MSTEVLFPSVLITVAESCFVFSPQYCSWIHTQQTHTLHSISLMSHLVFPSVSALLWAWTLEGFIVLIHCSLLHEWIIIWTLIQKRSSHCYPRYNATSCWHCPLHLYNFCCVGMHWLWPRSPGCVCGCCSRPAASRWPLPRTLIHSSPSASPELCWALRGTQGSQGKEEDTDSLHPRLQNDLLNTL